MEKQWVKDITESPQCKMGLINTVLLAKQSFEDPTADFDDSKFYDSDDSLNDDYIPPKEILREDLIKFLKQIRESRGYDLDVSVPRLVSLLEPVDMKWLENKMYREGVMRALAAAMDNINAESKKETGMTYEFVDFEKIVDGYPFYNLFTFTARVCDTGVVKTLQAMVYSPPGGEPEVLEWRVKPKSSASDSSEGSDSADGK